jgi:tetratricopeptide (TPR) repeat protein
LNNKTLADLKQLEADAVQLVEKNLMDQALDKLNLAIMMCDRYASAYNNRAQVLRIMKRTSEALNDLNTAIQWSPNTKILGMAYTQRAILYKELGNLENANNDFMNGAKFGNPIAKTYVSNNPYAKLCSTMVALASQNK